MNPSDDPREALYQAGRYYLTRATIFLMVWVLGFLVGTFVR